MSQNRASIPLIMMCAVLTMAAGFFIGGEVIRAIYTKEMHGAAEDRAALPVSLPSLSEFTVTPENTVLPAWQHIDCQRTNAIVMATRKVAPSVVGIVVTQIQVVRNPYAGDNFFDFFFSPDLRPPRHRKIENIGSGFVISGDGMILTNYHVIKNASRLYVSFPDGRRIEGRIVGADEKSDLAVISAPGSNFRPVRFGNSDMCMIGEWSIALGNPFLNFINDAHPTVTVGVISALNRNFAPSKGVYYQGMIQTDASINRGNSGGPLVNALGEVIGINSFIFTGSAAHTGSVGIGFAIPINRARRVADELMAYGRRRQLWAGITVQDMSAVLATTLNHDGADGVAIVTVEPQGPGEASGLRTRDIIHKMDGRTIHSSADLDGFFLDYFVGDTVEIQYFRGGRPHNTNLVLKEFPGRR
ncbi:MAG: trypsin-like peptidase domain-containing protein [Chitinispirillales bacterium]|nr:trypsin-like peptidase domain-containing protein [Chitinispirillales bacterium]